MDHKKPDYVDDYLAVDFRAHPERYKIGRGEQGVLMAEPYKSEILPYWRFATPEKAATSAEKIYNLFLTYRDEDDFVGMDMARKFLQMGWTRSRRYANHSSGKKYNDENQIRPQDAASESSAKAQSAKIFFGFYQKAKDDPHYKARKSAWMKKNT